MKTKIILGTFFGDEGKGQTVHTLSTGSDLVVRFNGGHQAGHTVDYIDYDHYERHVFSTIVSGTLKGAATYYSQHCVFYPKAFYNELEALKKIGIDNVKFYIHPLCAITTLIDVKYSQWFANYFKHGSVGVGIHATLNRNETSMCPLYANDLFCENMLKHKLEYTYNRHYVTFAIENDYNYEEDLFYINKIRDKIIITDLSSIKDNYTNIIFEGAQGIMLDMKHGYYPNVTYSNTTCKNAMEIIKDNELPSPDIYYVMRSYLTRHGNGPLENECPSIREELINNSNETNVTNEYQGNFRYAYHSSDMMKYAISCNRICSKNSTEYVVVSCLDQTENMMYIDRCKRSFDLFVEDVMKSIPKLCRFIDLNKYYA